jgi:N-acetylglucosamine-6-phosphate deacetylase
VLSGGLDLGRAPILFVGAKIAAVGPRARARARGARAGRLDLDGYTLAPGFVDLHTHGAAGVDFADASPEDFERAMGHYLAHGVTAILASVYPSAWKRSLAVLEGLSAAIRSGRGRGVALGIHLEGPFVSPRKPGALPARHFRAPSARDAARLLDAGGGLVRTVTLAPELRGARELLGLLARRGVVAAFGHSDAGYAATRAALDEGVRYATHLFNAMNGLHHRAPGAVAALLEDPRVSVEVIADGHHVAAPALRLVNALKPPDKVILVSDSVAPCGLADGAYRFAGRRVLLRGGAVTLGDGRFAGSALTLDRAVRYQVEEAGAPLALAVRFATENPARAAGLARSRGAIGAGKRADLVLLDRELRVKATLLAGELVYLRGRL